MPGSPSAVEDLKPPPPPPAVEIAPSRPVRGLQRARLTWLQRKGSLYQRHSIVVQARRCSQLRSRHPALLERTPPAATAMAG